jgi:hypothetical protein
MLSQRARNVLTSTAAVAMVVGACEYSQHNSPMPSSEESVCWPQQGYTPEPIVRRIGELGISAQDLAKSIPGATANGVNEGKVFIITCSNKSGAALSASVEAGNALYQPGVTWEGPQKYLAYCAIISHSGPEDGRTPNTGLQAKLYHFEAACPTVN